MTAEIDYVPFATGGGANVYPPATYQALPVVGTGVQPGLADPQLANTTWRLAAMMTAALANVISQQLGNVNVLDDGNLAGLIANLTAAMGRGLADFVNLAGSAAGGTKTATWTADQITAGTALNGATFRGSSLTLNFNGAANGANGMDTGAVPVSNYLYIYAIYNPTTATWACLGTTAGTGATIYPGGNMPAGYTASVLIWAGLTDGSSNILAFAQVGSNIQTALGTVLTNGAATSFTSVSLTSLVPPCAKGLSGLMNQTGAGSSYIAVNSGGMGQTGVSLTGTASPFTIPILNNSQAIYYKVTASATTTINNSGYTI